MLNLVELL